MELYNSSKYMRYLIHLFHDGPLSGFSSDLSEVFHCVILISDGNGRTRIGQVDLARSLLDWVTVRARLCPQVFSRGFAATDKLCVSTTLRAWELGQFLKTKFLSRASRLGTAGHPTLIFGSRRFFPEGPHFALAGSRNTS